MRLKPADIEHIIDLIQKIAKSATKTDFLSSKEKKLLEAYRDYEWCKSEIETAKRLNHLKIRELAEQRLKQIEIPYDEDEEKRLKRKLYDEKIRHKDNVIEPLQDELDLYLAPLWPDLKRLSFQYENLQKWIWGTWLSDNIMSFENNIVYDNKAAMVKEFAKIHGDEKQTIRELKRIRERVRYQDKKPAETEQQKQADAEKTVIEVLGNYESENGNKKGMPLAELEQETERSWIELLSVLNSLGKKQLIEIHKGEGYVPYWLPVELDESPQLRGINANVWRFRLTSAGYELLKRETAQKPAETERKTNTSKVENKGIWGWIKKIALIATIIGTIVVILIFLFGDQICSPENEKTVVQQTMNDSPGGTQIAGDVYIEKRESNIYCELSPNIKRELILLLQKLREQYNDLSIKISVTSDKGSNVRHLVAKEMVNLLKDSGFEADLTQPIIRFTNDTSDVVIKANESDIEFITQLSKILKKFIKTNTPFSGMKNENFRRGELQIIIAGDPLFSSDGLITFQ